MIVGAPLATVLTGRSGDLGSSNSAAAPDSTTATVGPAEPSTVPRRSARGGAVGSRYLVRGGAGERRSGAALLGGGADGLANAGGVLGTERVSAAGATASADGVAGAVGLASAGGGVEAAADAAGVGSAGVVLASSEAAAGASGGSA